MSRLIPITTFAGKQVAVFGLGKSGLLSAGALIAGGADVVVFDDNDKMLADAQAAGLTTQDLRELDWSKSRRPGAGARRAADASDAALGGGAGAPHGVEIIGDIELFCRERAKSGRDCPLVAITGTNGKSTTTALIAHLIDAAGRDAQMGGNIGVPVLALEPFAPGPHLCARSLVLSDRSGAVAQSHRRHSAQRVGGSSRPPRHHGELRRDQGAAGRAASSRAAPR